jgi:small subunit ribosomal protein S16
MDIRTPRDGRSIEEIGTYDPLEPDAAKQITVNADRVKYWLSVGARPTDTVVSLLKKAGVECNIKRPKLTSAKNPVKPAPKLTKKAIAENAKAADDAKAAAKAAKA